MSTFVVYKYKHSQLKSALSYVKLSCSSSYFLRLEKEVDGMEKDSDSTVTSIDENTENFCNNPTRDILAEGILNVFKPSVDKLDESITATRAAQTELKLQLDALLEQLKEIEKAQNSMPEFSGKVKELINVKHKVTVITNVLLTSQERLASLHRLIEREQAKRRDLLESTSTALNN